MMPFPDSQIPTDEQKRKLCRMLYEALLDIRVAGWSGKAQQAADLASAFHNLPNGIWDDNFSLTHFRRALKAYSTKYPDAHNYMGSLDEVQALEQGEGKHLG